MSDDQHVWLAELATVRLEVDVLTRVSNMVAEEVRRTGLSDDADSIVTQALTCWCLLFPVRLPRWREVLPRQGEAGQEVAAALAA